MDQSLLSALRDAVTSPPPGSADAAVRVSVRIMRGGRRLPDEGYQPYSAPVGHQDTSAILAWIDEWARDGDSIRVDWLDGSGQELPRSGRRASWPWRSSPSPSPSPFHHHPEPHTMPPIDVSSSVVTPTPTVTPSALAAPQGTSAAPAAVPPAIRDEVMTAGLAATRLGMEALSEANRQLSAALSAVMQANSQLASSHATALVEGAKVGGRAAESLGVTTRELASTAARLGEGHSDSAAAMHAEAQAAQAAQRQAEVSAARAEAKAEVGAGRAPTGLEMVPKVIEAGAGAVESVAKVFTADADKLVGEALDKFMIKGELPPAFRRRLKTMTEEEINGLMLKFAEARNG